MNEAEIRNRLVTKILSCYPNKEEDLKQVQEVYQSAIDFFGEDKVDLQKTTIAEPWECALPSGSYGQLLRNLNTSFEADCSPVLLDTSWGVRLSDSSEILEALENSITKETLLKTRLPLYTILIHFHDITISNEEDESTKIEDIYVAVPITLSGKGRGNMFWLRTTVAKSHWISQYRHSHLPIGRGKAWLRPCLGNGPIRMTMETLLTEFDLNFWSLFWLELDQCIRVESIAGGPYMYLRDISINKHLCCVYKDFDFYNICSITTTHSELLHKLALRMLHTNKLQYSFVKGAVHIANSYVDFTVLASNCLLDFLGTLPEEHAQALAEALMGKSHIIYAKILTTGRINSYGSLNTFQRNCAISALPESEAGFTFKGKQVPFTIVDNLSDEDKLFYILIGPQFAACLLQKLSTIINYVYARKQLNSKIRTNKK